MPIRPVSLPLKILNPLKERLIEHLDLVFIGSYKIFLKRVNITMNDEPLLGWDPFCEDFVKANEKAVLKVAFEDLETSKHNEKIDVRGYVIKRILKISQSKITNPLQGIYVFRRSITLFANTSRSYERAARLSFSVNIVPT